MNEKDFGMILRKFTVLTSSLLFLFLAANLSGENRGIKLHVERLALVIGNSAYQTAPLKNPLNDAEDMTATLKKMGFKVILKKNADQRTMEDTIRYFGRQLRNGGIGLFYFAGHGMQVDGRNYLIPIDTQIESEADVKYGAVDAGLVLGKMEDAQNQLNLVILDACRNNPFSRNFRSTNRGLARMDAPKGSLIAYSTAPGEVAADGPERNGIFTKHLIRHMMTPELPIELLLKRVRRDVVSETSGRQIPWESSSLMGDFYFNPEKKSQVASSELDTKDKPNFSYPEKSEKGTIHTEKAYKSKISSKSASETQVAAFSDDNKRNIEPWTGIWNVEGDIYTLGIWAMKQKDKTVVSTRDSSYKIKGTVRGNQLKGRIGSDLSTAPVTFIITISSDGQSFEGTIQSHRPNRLKGKKKE